jgi:hypothetical protein
MSPHSNPARSCGPLSHGNLLQAPRLTAGRRSRPFPDSGRLSRRRRQGCCLSLTALILRRRACEAARGFRGDLYWCRKSRPAKPPMASPLVAARATDPMGPGPDLYGRARHPAGGTTPHDPARGRARGWPPRGDAARAAGGARPCKAPGQDPSRRTPSKRLTSFVALQRRRLTHGG